MASQHCTTCMAPLPLGEIGSITKCQYCGTEARILDPNPPAPAPVVAPQGRGIRIELGPSPILQRVEEVQEQLRERAEEASSNAARVWIVFGIMGVIGVAFAILFLSSPSSPTSTGPSAVSADPAALPVPAPAAPTAAPGLTRGQLATFDLDEWTKLDTTGMPGAWNAFDPIAATPWALDLARAWSPDARLRILYVEGVAPDGSLDLSTPSQPGGQSRDVDWRFYSPARRQAAASMAQVSEQTVHTGFRISLDGGEAKVYAFSPSGDDPSPPEFTPACPLSRVIEAYRTVGMPLRPHYDMMLHDVPQGRRSRWIWEENMYLELPSGVRGDESCQGVRLPR